MKEEYKKRISWDREAEQFTPFLPRETGLPVAIYLDDGMAADTYGHPIVLFVQNSYNENDVYYRHLICMTVDEYTENVFNTPLRIRHADYMKVKIWVIRNIDLIQRLSNRDIDSYMFMQEYRQRKIRRRAANESLEKQLNEMATLDGSFIGLPFGIWIDNGQIWKSTKHAARIKIQTTNKSKKTTNWNPLMLHNLEFSSNASDAKNYSAKDIAAIKEFVKANYDFIKEVTCGDKIYTTDEVIEGILTMEDIKNNKTAKNVDAGIRKLIYCHTLGKNGEYTVVLDNETNKYSIVNSATQENAIGNKWVDAVVPLIKITGSDKFISVYIGNELEVVKLKPVK